VAHGKPLEAAAALKTALDMALPDRLYMPFAENRSLLGSILDESCPAAALGEIHALAEKQEAGKAVILQNLYSPLSLGLNTREYEVAQLAAAGLSNRQIAARLFLSEGAVKSRLIKVFEKLSVSSRKQLADALNM
jgi:LuxR family maltose regulon positive regulatory protein